MQVRNGQEKPRYLGLLNAISLAESHAGVYLRAWADATSDPDLECTLRLVAARESSHGDVFCRRLAELGYELRQKNEPGSEERIARFGNPKIGDLEKIGRARNETERDPFGEIEQKIRDGFYDPMTANLLTWYMAEERDSTTRLREAFARVRAKSGEAASGHAANSNGNGAMRENAANGSQSVSADAMAIMACMADGFSRLERKLETLARA